MNGNNSLVRDASKPTQQTHEIPDTLTIGGTIWPDPAPAAPFLT